MKYRDLLRSGLVVASSGLVLAACGSAPTSNAQLDQAKQAYATASADPTVRQASSGTLENAQEALSTAQSYWDNMQKSSFSSKEDEAAVTHYAYLAQRYSEIAQEGAKVRTAAIQATTTARVMTLGDMLFATGKADLNSEGTKAVGQLATFLRNYPDRTVAIVGYTDSTGSMQINEALSQQRAAAVQQALIQDGINGSRLEAKGMGPANPVASNKTASGRQQNRRVEVAISGMQPEAGATGTTTAPK